MKNLLLSLGLLVSSTLASVQLTQDNIKLKTAQDNWFVLYSNQPTLVSTWQQLSDEHKDWKQHGVFFGQVDCSTESKLCNKDNKDSIQVYHNGDIVTSYPATEQLTSITKHQIVSGTYLRGSVALKKDTLDLITKSNTPWFIKFYAPWCGHCKKLVPIWDTLAATLESTTINLAEVNCETDRDLCSSQKVAGLPTLKFYNSGASFEYAGDRTLEHLQQYVTKMTGPATVPIDDSSLESVYSNPVAVIHTGGDLEAIKKVAAKFIDTVPFYTTTDSKVLSALKLDNARTVLIKDGGSIQHVFAGNDDNELVNWVRQYKYPLVTRIHSGNAKEILKGDRLVVLMLLPNEMASSSFQSLARLDDSLIFAELNGQAWSSYVERVYGVTMLPALVIVDPKARQYYKQDLDGFDFSSDRPDALLAALKQKDQLVGYTMDPPRSVSSIQKLVTFMGDHALVFGIGLFGLCALVFALATSGTTTTTQEDKKKED